MEDLTRSRGRFPSLATSSMLQDLGESVSLLFEDFLANSSTYAECERFWANLIAEIEASLGQSGGWPSWIPKTYADGVTLMERDGNPIVDGFSRKLDRAFRVTQEPPDSGGALVGAYLTHSGDPIYEGADWPMDDLTIVLTLTEESAQVARRLLEIWMDPKRPITDTETAIGTLQIGDV